MDECRHSIASIITGGIKRNEIRSDVDAIHVATILLTLFEGGLMLSKLHQNPKHLKDVTDHMRSYLKSLYVG